MQSYVHKVQWQLNNTDNDLGLRDAARPLWRRTHHQLPT